MREIKLPFFPSDIRRLPPETPESRRSARLAKKLWANWQKVTPNFKKFLKTLRGSGMVK